MAQTTTTQKTSAQGAHQHRTAKVIELMGVSTQRFEGAVQNAVEDAQASRRRITGAHVGGFSVKVNDGKITEQKVNLKVAFGTERTMTPD